MGGCCYAKIKVSQDPKEPKMTMGFPEYNSIYAFYLCFQILMMGEHYILNDVIKPKSRGTLLLPNISRFAHITKVWLSLCAQCQTAPINTCPAHVVVGGGMEAVFWAQPQNF